MIRRVVDRHLPPGRFGRGVAVLTGGSLLSQALAVLSLPVITRLYTPEELGIFGLAWSIVTLLSVAACLRYEYAIPTEAAPRDAAVVLLLAIAVSIPYSLATMSGLAVLIRLGVWSTDVLPPWAPILLLPLLVSLGVGSAVRFWLVREQRFPAIAAMVVRQGLARLVVTVASGFAGLGWIGLAIGELAGRLAGVGRPLAEALGGLSGSPRGTLVDESRAAARRHERAPRILMPSALLDAMASALLVPVTLALHGSAAAGMLLMVQRILSVPSALVGTGVADVFHGSVAEQLRKDPTAVRGAYFRTMRRLMVLGVATVAPVALLAPWAFPILLGSEWAQTGWLAAAMAPWALAALVVSPVSRLVILLGREHWKLLYDVLALLGLFVGMHGGSRMGLSFVETLLLTSVLQAIAYAAFAGLMWKALDAHERPEA